MQSKVIVPISILVPYIYSDDNLFLWVQTRETADDLVGLLEFPGGKIEPSEIPLEACIREVEEEVGVIVPEDELALLEAYFFEGGEKSLNIYVYLFNDTKRALFERDGHILGQELLKMDKEILPNNKQIISDVLKYFQEFRDMKID